MNVATSTAGWYPDPYREAESRYWDGERWTGEVYSGAPAQPLAAVQTVPQPAAPAAALHVNGNAHLVPRVDAGAPAEDPTAPQFDLPSGGDIGQLGVVGADGLTVEQVNAELRRGARFVVYPYVISLLLVTLRRGSSVFFVPAGKSAVPKGLPFAGISLLLGWWGFPWGFIFTPLAIVRNLSGGKNVTNALVEVVNSHSGEAAAAIAAAAAAEGPRSGVLQTVPEPAMPAAPSPAPAPPAGWHPDPSGQARLRYWDGHAWTEHTHA